MKYTVSFASDVTVFTDKNGKVTDKFDNVVAVDQKTAIVSLKREGEARVSGTQGALSLVVDMLDCPRMDFYKGKTAPNDKIPNEAKNARRELEVEFLKPLFLETIKGKCPEEKKHAQWDAFIELHRKGGVWSLVNSVALQYFCIVGRLPCVYIDGKPHKDKLLSQPAMQKIIANMRAAEDTTDKGIAGKLADIAALVKDRNEKTHMGHTGTAIASLKAMLAEFEAIDRKEREEASDKARAAMSQTDIDAQSKAIVAKAYKAAKPEVAPL